MPMVSRNACSRTLLPSLGVALAIAILTPGSAPADDWPQWLGPRRDGIWRETGILNKFPAEGPRKRWATPIAAGYSGPAIAGDRVYITDRVLAGNAKNPANPFARTAVPSSERVLCLDDATGKVIWTHEYDCPYSVSYPAGPRTTPLISGGKVYTIGTMGDLLCLDAATGKVLWSKNFPRDFDAKVPMWGFSASPLLDGDKLICLVGGAGSVVVAFHKDTGKELWRALDAGEIGYCPAEIFEFGGKRELIVWDPDSVNALDPESGKPLWSQKFTVKAGMTIPTPRQAGNTLFVSCFYNGSMMLSVDPSGSDAKVLWKSKGKGEFPAQTDTLHCVMATPFIKDGYIYGVCSYGQLRCIDAATGARIWSTQQPTTGGPEFRWANAFIVAQEDRYFLFNEKGDLILARLSPKGYDEISRAHIVDPTNEMVAGQRQKGKVVWSHPAFAHRSVYARNDKELVCYSLAASEAGGK